MVLSNQAQRAWKTGTAILSSMTAFHVVFQVDYGEHDHCFSDLQKWYRNKMDTILLGNDAVNAANNAAANDATAAQASISSESIKKSNVNIND